MAADNFPQFPDATCSYSYLLLQLQLQMCLLMPACVTSVGKGFHFTLPHSMFVFYVHPRKKDAM